MKSFDEDRNEKIAKIFLSSLKGAKIEPAAGKWSQGVDFWISSGKEGDQPIAVEVKSFTGVIKKDDLIEKYRSSRNWFANKYPSGILMYINGKEAQAYFEVVGNENEKIYTLTADTISSQIKRLKKVGLVASKKTGKLSKTKQAAKGKKK